MLHENIDLQPHQIEKSFGSYWGRGASDPLPHLCNTQEFLANGACCCHPYLKLLTPHMQQRTKEALLRDAKALGAGRANPHSLKINEPALHLRIVCGHPEGSYKVHSVHRSAHPTTTICRQIVLLKYLYVSTCVSHLVK